MTTNEQIVRDKYPELSPQNQELFRTILALSVILLKSMQDAQGMQKGGTS